MNFKAGFKETEIGLIPIDWELAKLKDISIDISYGYTASANTEKVGPKFLRITDIVPPIINWDSVPYCIIEKKNLKKNKLEKGDIVIARTGANTGANAIFKEDIAAVFASYLIRFRINNKMADPFYVAHIMKSELWNSFVESILGGSAQPGANAKQFGNFSMPLPSISEQKAISKVISDLDNKIELNQKMNQTLEEIGQAIFKQWFVNFEFPDADSKPYKSSGGEMVDSELGWIPKDWKVDKLGNYIDLERGLSYKGKFLCDDGKPMVNLGTIAPNCGFIHKGLKYYSGDFKEKNLVNVGDLVIANTDITQDRKVLGSPAIVPPDLGCENALFTHHIFAVRNNSFLHNLFLYYLLQLRAYKGRVEGFATGTTVLALPKDAILDFEFPVPDESLINQFRVIIQLIHEKIDQNNIQSKNLSSIRDSLIPRLISGKIRVKENIYIMDFDQDSSKRLEALE